MLEDTVTAARPESAAPLPPAAPFPADDEPPADLGVVEALGEIGREIAKLRGAVDDLTAAMRGGLAQAGTPALGVAPTVPDEEARAAIREYFLKNAGDTLFPDRIAHDLGLSVTQVAAICESFAAEGTLERE